MRLVGVPSKIEVGRSSSGLERPAYHSFAKVRSDDGVEGGSVVRVWEAYLATAGDGQNHRFLALTAESKRHNGLSHLARRSVRLFSIASMSSSRKITSSSLAISQALP